MLLFLRFLSDSNNYFPTTAQPVTTESHACTLLLISEKIVLQWHCFFQERMLYFALKILLNIQNAKEYKLKYYGRTLNEIWVSDRFLLSINYQLFHSSWPIQSQIKQHNHIVTHYCNCSCCLWGKQIRMKMRFIQQPQEHTTPIYLVLLVKQLLYAVFLAVLKSSFT